jgi:hypothetical protein
MYRLAITFALLFAACIEDESIDSSEYAIDADHSGTVDCADIEHVNACINHHIADACDVSDVNHDGVVDAEDVHHIYTALHDSGHACTDPTQH